MAAASPNQQAPTPHVVALTGGVGGAKLALGLSRIMPPEDLRFIVNTGDDFEYLGLNICPDLDTLLYTLSGLSDESRGWGRRDETWNFMSALAALGGDAWFQLGDADLAVHVQRSHRLRLGQSKSEITAWLAQQLGLRCQVLPMSDQPVRTRLRGSDGWLDFQDYFVRQRCEPVIDAIEYVGADIAQPAPGVIDSITSKHCALILLCPSNPWLSIDPILAVPGIRAALRASTAPVVAVSPVINGKAVKGPTVKLMRELGLRPVAGTVATHYADFLDLFLVDPADVDELSPPPCRIEPAQILMRDLADRERLARTVLSACGTAITQTEPG